MKELRIERITSYNSLKKGITYCSENKVHNLEKIDDERYKAIVDGSMNNTYEVIFNVNKIKKSTCTCPYCDGHESRFCKHKVAVYFKLFPDEYEYILNREKEYEEECQQQLEIYEQKLHDINERARKEVLERMSKMTDEEIRHELFIKLMEEETKYDEEELDQEYQEYLDYYY